jgi:hypothetical protein
MSKSFIKHVTVNEGQWLHAKGKQAGTIRPFWRRRLSLNHSLEAIMILSPIDYRTEDRVMLSQGHRRDLSMPTNTLRECKIREERLDHEIPAFPHWLKYGFEIRQLLRSNKFEIKHFHNPISLGIMRELLSDENILFDFDHN